MGQKTNPNILLLNKTNNWEYQYFEKKSTELSAYTFKNLEIESFIFQFFKVNGFIIQGIKLYHFDKILYIIVFYFLNSNDKKKRILFKGKQIKGKKKKPKKRFNTKYNIQKHLKYKQLKYLKSLSNINLAFNNLSYRNLKKMQFLDNYKKNLIETKNNNLFNKKTSFFINKFLEGISLFTKKNISLTLKQLNKNIRKEILKKEKKLIKKSLIKLRKYKQNKFFKEGINILFACVKTKGSAKLLSKYIAEQFKNLKRHNFFLKFIKTTLTYFFNKKFSNCKGIKIQIRGRFNGVPRAKHRIINVGNGVPVLTIDSRIDYNESTAFTSNGTFGIKIWVNEKI